MTPREELTADGWRQGKDGLWRNYRFGGSFRANNAILRIGSKKGELTRTPDPGPARDDWIDFLYWLADRWVAKDVVEVVEKPWNYAEEYADYLAEGGVDR